MSWQTGQNPLTRAEEHYAYTYTYTYTCTQTIRSHSFRCVANISGHECTPTPSIPQALVTQKEPYPLSAIRFLDSAYSVRQ